MNCPDTDRLVDLLHADTPDMELLGHVQSCPSCRAELRLVRAIPGTFQPQIQVSERLIRRTVAALDNPTEARRDGGTTHMFVAAFLGAATIGATLAVTGVAAVGSPGWVVGFSALGGIAVGLKEFSAQRRAAT